MECQGGASEGICVVIRVRPLNENETQSKQEKIFQCVPEYNAILQLKDNQSFDGQMTYFDKVFDENSSTIDVHSYVSRDIVKGVIQGINGTIFAYGQTSSGKTHTMLGSEQNSGILELVAKDIFHNIANSPGRDYLIRVSFVEIYNENIRDLLSEAGESYLNIREDPRKGVYCEATEIIITDYESIIQVLNKGSLKRTVESTAMNETSSRSHTIFRLVIESRASNRLGTEIDGAVLVASLNLVDLAGSESVRHTGATGQRAKEGGKINQSLLSLSRVIHALSQSGTSHIPFRESKLTRLLQPSLSGNAKMSVICCITPAEKYLEETKSTLQFASRAKLVKTHAKVNEVLDEAAQLRKLKKELSFLKERQKMEGNNEEDQQRIELERMELQRQLQELQEEKSKHLIMLDRYREMVLIGGAAQQDQQPALSKKKRVRRKTWCSGMVMYSPSKIIYDLNKENNGGFIPEVASWISANEAQYIDKTPIKTPIHSKSLSLENSINNSTKIKLQFGKSSSKLKKNADTNDYLSKKVFQEQIDGLNSQLFSAMQDIFEKNFQIENLSLNLSKLKMQLEESNAINNILREEVKFLSKKMEGSENSPTEIQEIRDDVGSPHSIHARGQVGCDDISDSTIQDLDSFLCQADSACQNTESPAPSSWENRSYPCVDDLLLENAILQKDVTLLRDRKVQVEERLFAIEQEIERLQAFEVEFNKLREEKSVLEEKHNLALLECAGLSEQSAGLAASLEQSQQQILHLKGLLEVEQLQSQELNTRLMSREGDLGHAIQNCSEQRSRIESLTTKLASFVSESLHLPSATSTCAEENLDTVIQSHQEALLLIDQLFSEKRDAEGRLSDSKVAMVQLSEENKCLKEKLSTGAKKEREKSNLLEEEIHELNTQIQHLKAGKIEVENKYSFASDKVIELERLVEAIMEDKKRVEHKLSQIESSHSQAYTASFEINEKLNKLISDENTSLKAELQKLVAQVGQLKEEQATAHQQIAKLNSRNQRHAENQKILCEEIAQLNGLISTLQEKYNQLIEETG